MTNSDGTYSDVSRKLMASMGWTKGKGLGKHEQGADKHIEHKKRGDNVGLGADATVEAQFAAGLHKGSAKAAFGDQGWVDAFVDGCVEINQCVGCTTILHLVISRQWRGRPGSIER